MWVLHIFKSYRHICNIHRLPENKNSHGVWDTHLGGGFWDDILLLPDFVPSSSTESLNPPHGGFSFNTAPGEGAINYKVLTPPSKVIP